MQTCKTINYRGFQIDIVYDESSENPREWSNLGTMICFHRNYNLGDYEITKKTFQNEPEYFMQFLEEHGNEIIFLPLCLYDHSGLVMNTVGFSCPWDSGQVGVIYVTKEKLRKEYNWKYITKSRKEKVVSYLKNEVEVYDQYLRGDVYGYIVKSDEDDHLDSCFGYFGDPDKSGIIDEAKSSVDHQITIKAKEHADKLKAQIRNRTPLQYRLPLGI